MNKTALLLAAALALTACSTEHQMQEEEQFNYSVLFCARQDCLSNLKHYIEEAAGTVNCAFYRADKYILKDLPGSVNATLILDKEAGLNISGARKHVPSKTMHNKYCIIDGSIVITGSFNPVPKSIQDYDNLLIINSTAIAQIYSGNSESMIRQDKRKGRGTSLILNATLVDVRFCPYDNCVGTVKKELMKAKRSIHFATYTFTHPVLANELILKKYEGVKISGIIEKNTAGRYSKHRLLMQHNISVVMESTERRMHHKFFVIDNQTVITGSFNPTKNGAERNYENMLIVHNKEVAAEYAAEFDRLRIGTAK